MRGANVVRRRSVTNLGETAGDTGSVNGGQADGGGSGLLAGGSDPGGNGAAARRDKGSTGPQVAIGQAAAAQGVQGGAVAPSNAYGGQPAAPGTGRPAPARPRRSASAQSRFALTNWRVRWRLVAVIAVPTLTAAILGSLQIYGDVSNWNASGRVQHLAQLNSAVVRLTQALEDERDLSAGFAANRSAGGTLPGQLKSAQNATIADTSTVTTLAAGVSTGAGYQPATVQDLNALTDSLQDLKYIRNEVTSSLTPASKIVQVYSENIIDVANTFSATVGNGANDADLETNVTTLGALLRTENEMSAQRGILYAALSSPTGTLRPEDLSTLQQSFQQEQADESEFTASTSTAEQQVFSNTVSGAQVDLASSEEDLAESIASANSTEPLTHNPEDK